MLPDTLFRKDTIGLIFPIWLLLTLFPAIVQAQARDKLYLIDETAVSGVDILEINEKKVKYRSKEGKEESYHTKHVLLAFNGQGKYLTFPNTAEEVSVFFTTEGPAAGYDLIVTLGSQVIPGHIEKEDEFELSFQDLTASEERKKLSTTELAAVIYKDGTHKLFTSPSQASSILSVLEKQVTSRRQTLYAASAGQPKVLLARKEEAEEPKEVVVENSTLLAASKAAPATVSIDFKAYQQKALQKAADLGMYLGVISNRSSDLAKANKAVELALRLFVDENAQVEVSSKAGKNRYAIRTYLNRLKLLKYDQVEISWSDISYVSELRKGSDGNYYGIITLQQRFNGFVDGELAYSDLTEKNVEVVLKAYEKEEDGKAQELWDVFLSDIGVVVTNFD